jgi:hypothetical protein
MFINITFLDIIHRPIYISKHNVSGTGFCLRLKVKPTNLGEDGDIIQSPKRCFEIEILRAFR